MWSRHTVDVDRILYIMTAFLCGTEFLICRSADPRFIYVVWNDPDLVLWIRIAFKWTHVIY
jgi:hypothetical protein